MQEPKCYPRSSITTWACRDVNEMYENVSKVGQGTYGYIPFFLYRESPLFQYCCIIL